MMKLVLVELSLEDVSRWDIRMELVLVELSLEDVSRWDIGRKTLLGK